MPNWCIYVYVEKSVCILSTEHGIQVNAKSTHSIRVGRARDRRVRSSVTPRIIFVGTCLNVIFSEIGEKA